MLNKSQDQVNSFYKAYRGAFTSLLKWSDLDAFWQILSAQSSKGWYIYVTAEQPPEKTTSADEMKQFIREIDQLLHEKHKEDYCGIVYTDDKTSPSFIKIYHPENLGVVCGIGREPIFPGWIISQLKPETLDKLPPLPGTRKSWWRRFFLID